MQCVESQVVSEIMNQLRKLTKLKVTEGFKVKVFLFYVDSS